MMVSMKDVVLDYSNGKRALHGVNFEVEQGEFVFLVGPSGSGKSSIVKLLTAELRPTQGEVEICGYDVGTVKRSQIPFLRRQIGVVFQDFRIIPNKTIYENVAFAMHVFGAKRKEIKQRVSYVLELVGLADMAKRTPDQISGGELQRVGIARALVNNPQLIIADEPTGNLDPAFSLDIMMLLEKINELGTTILVVSHEKELVNRLGKRVLALDAGRIVSDRTGGYVFPEEVISDEFGLELEEEIGKVADDAPEMEEEDTKGIAPQEVNDALEAEEKPEEPIEEQESPKDETDGLENENNVNDQPDISEENNPEEGNKIHEERETTEADKGEEAAEEGPSEI